MAAKHRWTTAVPASGPPSERHGPTRTSFTFRSRHLQSGWPLYVDRLSGFRAAGLGRQPGAGSRRPEVGKRSAPLPDEALGGQLAGQEQLDHRDAARRRRKLDGAEIPGAVVAQDDAIL